MKKRTVIVVFAVLCVFVAAWGLIRILRLTPEEQSIPQLVPNLQPLDGGGSNEQENPRVMEPALKISDDQAIEIAKNTLKANVHVKYCQEREIVVERRDGRILVFFPVRLKPGERGPDYAELIFIDAETGEVLLRLSGS
jgi:hypothetical protein